MKKIKLKSKSKKNPTRFISVNIPETPNLNPKNMKQLETIYLMNIIPYVKDLETIQKIVFINRKCYHAINRLKINPFYSRGSINTKEKTNELRKELNYFNALQTFQSNLEMIEYLTPQEIETLDCFSITEKIIYPIPRFKEIASKITHLSMYVDIDLHIPLKDMILLKSLHIDINNNTEMLFFDEYLKNIFIHLQEFQHFHKLIIECNGLELKKIIQLLQHYEWYTIDIIIKCFDLQDNHFSQIDISQVNNLQICCFSNTSDCISTIILKNRTSLKNIMILYDIPYELSIPIEIINESTTQQMMNQYYLYRLKLYGYSNEEIIMKEIKLINSNYLNEIYFHNITFQKRCYVELPISVTSLRLYHCSHFSFINLQSLQLQHLSFDKCVSIHKLHFPSSLTSLEIKNSSIGKQLSLSSIHLLQLHINNDNHLKTLILPSSLTTLSLYWCNSLESIINIESTSLIKMILFQCKLLSSLTLPISMKYMYNTFCNQLIISNMNDLTQLQTSIL